MISIFLKYQNWNDYHHFNFMYFRVTPSNPHLQTDTLTHLIATFRQRGEWHFLGLRYFLVLCHMSSVSPSKNKYKSNFLFSPACEILVTHLAVLLRPEDTASFRWVILWGSKQSTRGIKIVLKGILSAWFAQLIDDGKS